MTCPRTQFWIEEPMHGTIIGTVQMTCICVVLLLWPLLHIFYLYLYSRRFLCSTCSTVGSCGQFINLQPLYLEGSHKHDFSTKFLGFGLSSGATSVGHQGKSIWGGHRSPQCDPIGSAQEKMNEFPCRYFIRKAASNIERKPGLIFHLFHTEYNCLRPVGDHQHAAKSNVRARLDRLWWGLGYAVDHGGHNLMIRMTLSILKMDPTILEFLMELALMI